MSMTHHAKVRSQQRGIPPLVVDLLLQFGVHERAPGGVSKVFLDKHARRRLESYVGTLAPQIEQHLNVYLVVNGDNQVITAAPRTERIRRH